MATVRQNESQKAPIIQKGTQPLVDKERHTCCCFWELSRGISILVRLQILTSLLFFYSYFFKIVTNAFNDDPKMQLFLGVQMLTNIPRLYACYLAW